MQNEKKKEKNGECELRQHNFKVLNKLFQVLLLGSTDIKYRY